MSRRIKVGNAVTIVEIVKNIIKRSMNPAS